MPLEVGVGQNASCLSDGRIRIDWGKEVELLVDGTGTHSCTQVGVACEDFEGIDSFACLRMQSEQPIVLELGLLEPVACSEPPLAAAAEHPVQGTW